MSKENGNYDNFFLNIVIHSILMKLRVCKALLKKKAKDPNLFNPLLILTGLLNNKAVMRKKNKEKVLDDVWFVGWLCVWMGDSLP